MNGLLMAAVIASGSATRYDPGVMDAVIENRVAWGQLPPGVKAGECVALLDCSWVGDQIYLDLADGSTHGPYLVADCAQDAHRADLERIGFAVDLSYELAAELGALDGPLPGVTIWQRRPMGRYVLQ